MMRCQLFDYDSLLHRLLSVTSPISLSSLRYFIASVSLLLLLLCFSFYIAVLDSILVQDAIFQVMLSHFSGCLLADCLSLSS